MSQEKQIPHMKTIGVIGGLGPQATMDIVARLHKVSQNLVPQFVNRGYPPLLVGYFRDAPMVLREDGSVPNELRPDPRLLELARTLGLHVDFLIIASNTPHIFVKEIEEASGRKVLSIVDAVLEDVQRRRCSKVGVLAIGETLQHRLYQDRLDQIGVAWEIIPDSLIKRLDESSYAVMEGTNPAELAEPVREAVAYLREKKADGIIVGCTELPLLLGKEVEQPDIINPSQLLAEAAIRYSIG